MSEGSMPIEIDHRRRSLSVPKRLMPTLLAIHTGDQVHPAETIAELEAGGLLLRMTLDPLVVSLIAAMTDPTLVVTVESIGAHTSRLATIWGSAQRAVLGTTVDRDQFDLLQIDPDLLPFHLAQITELIPRSLPPFSGAVVMPKATLQSVERLITRDQHAAERELRQAGLMDPWPDWLLIALAHRRALWTVAAVWIEGRDRRTEQMTVLDAGSAGYWIVQEDADQATVSLRASSFDQLLQRCSALLPTAPQ
jgi:hypothetical protein